MAPTRIAIAARYVSRRFLSSGKVFGEEQKAAENAYIKKMEKERLEKLARDRKGSNGGETPAASSGGSGSVGGIDIGIIANLD